MPTRRRRENTFIQQFLSAYEDFSWAEANIQWLDEVIDGTVEALVTRSDGGTLALEHTIVEPFIGDKEDFAFFSQIFLPIENDETLVVPHLWLNVGVPVGILKGMHKRDERICLADAVHEWLRQNRSALREGTSEKAFHVTMPRGRVIEMTLYIRVTSVPGNGALTVRRQQMEDNLHNVVERALAKKLPKLVETVADRHLLILERQHMNLIPERMMAVLGDQRS